MILYQDNLITLDYSPATDVLFVESPDIAAETHQEIEGMISRLSESIRSYDVKYLLLDSSKNAITLTDAAYVVLLENFRTSIGQTRLQKFARIRSQDMLRENTIETTLGNGNIPAQFKNFRSRTEASAWLTNKPA